METGIELIAQERAEQIEKHGRTIESDITINGQYELRRMAIALMEHDATKFPLGWYISECEYMLNKSYKDRLIIAGALIAAEIDRINNMKTNVSHGKNR